MLRKCNQTISNILKNNVYLYQVDHALKNVNRSYSFQSSCSSFYHEFLHPEYFHVVAMSNFFESIHVELGIPWYLSIISGTIILKSCISLPAQIIMERNVAKQRLLLPKLQDLYKRINEETDILVKQKRLPDYAKLKFRYIMVYNFNSD